MIVFVSRKMGSAITITVWIAGEGKQQNFGKRRVLEYVGVVMRSYHCGSLQPISTIFHLNRALLAMKKSSLKSIESCERQPPVFQQCQALKLVMLNARFQAPIKIRSLAPKRVILHSV